MKDIYAKKSLGQNFLKDEIVLKKIADSFDVSKNDLIIEIGPGMGALTKYLVKKNSSYLAYEIDERMRNYLEVFQDNNKMIIYDDFLKRDIKKDLRREYENIYVVANIPYYITTPIIEHILNSIVVSGMTLLVQKEVADRFSASPGSKDYGYFTVLLNHFFEVKKLFDVPPSSFVPAPKVMSSVVKMKRKVNLEVIDVFKFQLFVKQIFVQKRKTLKNNLKNYDWEKVFSILLNHGYGEKVRAEELSYEVILELYQKLVLEN